MLTHYEEDKLLAAALKYLGLKFWREPRSWDVKVTDLCGKHEFDGYTEDGDWVDTGISSVEALGETKTFVRVDSWVFSSKERSERVIENPFFGIVDVETLAMKLDLFGAKKVNKLSYDC